MEGTPVQRPPTSFARSPDGLDEAQKQAAWARRLQSRIQEAIIKRREDVAEDSPVARSYSKFTAPGASPFMRPPPPTPATCAGKSATPSWLGDSSPMAPKPLEFGGDETLKEASQSPRLLHVASPSRRSSRSEHLQATPRRPRRSLSADNLDVLDDAVSELCAAQAATADTKPHKRRSLSAETVHRRRKLEEQERLLGLRAQEIERTQGNFRRESMLQTEVLSLREQALLSREETLNDREQRLSQAEDDLRTKDEKLSLREQSLISRESTATSRRSDSIGGRSCSRPSIGGLDDRDQELKEREEELEDSLRDLDRRREFVAARELELNEFEMGLVEREARVAEREDALTARELASKLTGLQECESAPARDVRGAVLADHARVEYDKDDCSEDEEAAPSLKERVKMRLGRASWHLFCSLIKCAIVGTTWNMLVSAPWGPLAETVMYRVSIGTGNGTDAPPSPWPTLLSGDTDRNQTRSTLTAKDEHLISPAIPGASMNCSCLSLASRTESKEAALAEQHQEATENLQAEVKDSQLELLQCLENLEQQRRLADQMREKQLTKSSAEAGPLTEQPLANSSAEAGLVKEQLIVNSSVEPGAMEVMSTQGKWPILGILAAAAGALLPRLIGG